MPIIALGATWTPASVQIGSSPLNGSVLQTDGILSSWVATSTLGITAPGDGTFSTTSANYWESLLDRGHFFATTSADYWVGLKGYQTSADVNSFIHSSTTIPKTYTENNFTNGTTTMKNAYVTGNLQVDGSFFAPVTVVVSGDMNMGGYSITNGLNSNFSGNTVLGYATTTQLTSTLSWLGTILSGTWNGSTIGAQYGGTGSTTLSGILKGNGTGVVQTAVAGTDYLTRVRWHDGLEIVNPTSTPNTALTTGGTDESLKFGNCTEPGGSAIVVDKVSAIISTTTSAAPDGVTWNIYIGVSTFSTSSPLKLFTNDINTNATASQQVYTTGFSQSTIPAGGCYWFAASAASSTVKGLNFNMHGY